MITGTVAVHRSALLNHGELREITVAQLLRVTLNYARFSCIIIDLQGRPETHNPLVPGSSPGGPTNLRRTHYFLAATVNVKAGETPPPGFWAVTGAVPAAANSELGTRAVS